MNFALLKVKNLATILWNHKKKSLFAAGLASYGFSYLHAYNRDSRIRKFYGLEAKRYGEAVIYPTAAIRRVTVLINEEANGRKVKDAFNNNALPLLNLAGLDVNVIIVKNADEMESLGKALDKPETDCVCLVGGDGTVARFITGVMKNVDHFMSSKRAPLPISIYPGGRHNNFLTRLLPNIFGETDDVRRYCESAMAIVENSTRVVSPVKCEMNSDENDWKTCYFLSSLNAGWMEHCEQKKPKLWYFGALRSYVVYFWEFLKRYPEPMNLRVTYQEFCDGCNKCRSSVKHKSAEERHWIWKLIGTRRPSKIQKDYSKVENERCGTVHNLAVDATDLNVFCNQEEDCSQLEFIATPPLGRFEAMKEGWKRSNGKEAESLPKITSPVGLDENASGARFIASKVFMQFIHLPDFIQNLSVAGDWGPFENFAEKAIRLENSDVKIEVFLPNTKESRLKLEDC